jgi:Carboxypeptidase regulatory-like domain
MNKIQAVKLKNRVGLNNFFQTNNTVAATVINAAVWIPKLKAITTDIITHAALQSTPFTGSTLDKKVVKAKIVNDGFLIAASAKGYARSVSNTVLYDKVNYTLASLQNMNDVDLLSAANIIYAAVHADIALITSVTHLDPAKLVDYEQTITDFTNFMPQAQIGRGSSKIHTEAIARLIKESDDLLEEVDDYMTVISFTEPLFYKEYLNARLIGNAITRNRALEINVVSKATNRPIHKAEISLTSGTGVKLAMKKTTAKGNSYFQDLKENDYTVHIAQAGYTDITQNISVVDGSTFSLSVEME